MLNARLFLLFLTVTVLTACSTEFGEKNTPLHPPEPAAFEPSAVQFTIRSRIPMSVIEPTGIRRTVRKIIGWIPIAGDIAEIPLDLAQTLMPNLPSSDVTRLPDGLTFTDPSTLELIESIEITAVQLNVTPENQRGENYKRSRCYVFFKCRDQDLEFIKELQLVLAERRNPDNTVTLAKATRNKSLSKNKKTLNLQTNSKVNLVDFLLRLQDFEILTLATGKPPKHDLYLEGYIDLKITLKM